MGGEVTETAQPGRPPNEFASVDFLPPMGSLVHVTRPSTWYVPLVLLPFLIARRGADLQGLGLLD